MLLVQHDGIVAGVAVIGFGDEFSADLDLGGEADDASADLVFDEVADGLVDVAWVSGIEGAEDEEDLSGAVGGGVKKARSSHLQRVFETRLTAGFLLS